MQRISLVGAVLAALAAPCAAIAAGYDTPVLYSARHMGMGGTAIGYVDDPSAPFHNPAGLGAIANGAVLGNFSPIRARIHGSPSDHVVTENKVDSRPGLNTWSETAFSPAFLAGAGYRLPLPELAWLKRAVVGFAVYPVASAGAEYNYKANYQGGVVNVRDYTKLVFIDVAPTLAVELVPGLRLGAAWRYASVSFDRVRAHPDTTAGVPSNVDLSMKGTNAEGFRVGLQYSVPLRFAGRLPSGDLSFGAVYRHRTDTTVSADTGRMLNLDAKGITYGFTLPSKFGVGVQYKGIDRLRLAADVEYTLQSQNDTTVMSGVPYLGAITLPKQDVPNISKWKDSLTLRAGAAYGIGDSEIRLGYILDGRASNPRFVSAFGTPPADTQSFTAGVGYKISKALDVSLAAAYRSGKASVTEADVKDNGCAFCGKQGDYELELLGGYLDVCYRFGE